MPATALSHLAICVSDIDRSLTFYRDLLGFRVVQDFVKNTGSGSYLHTFKTPQPKQRAVVMYFGEEDAGTLIALEQVPGAKPDGRPILLDQIGITHISFSVPDVPKMARELVAKGVETVGPLEAYQDASGHISNVYVRDPDGILIQFDEGITKESMDPAPQKPTA